LASSEGFLKDIDSASPIAGFVSSVFSVVKLFSEFALPQLPGQPRSQVMPCRTRPDHRALKRQGQKQRNR